MSVHAWDDPGCPCRPGRRVILRATGEQDYILTHRTDDGPTPIGFRLDPATGLVTHHARLLAEGWDGK